MNSVEIKDLKESIKAENRAMIDTAKKEERDLTDTEMEKFHENISRITELNEELRKLEDSLKNQPEIRKNSEDENKIEENNKQIKMEKKEFRLLKTINDIVNNKPIDYVSNAVINAGSEEARKAGVDFTGQIQIPTSEVRSAITVAAEGTDTVAVDVYDVLAPLRAKNVLIQAGAKYLGGLEGNVKVPVMSESNVKWAGETVNASDGAGAFTSVELSPKRLTAYVDVSKQFLLQTSDSAEKVIREDIVNAINTKLESTVLGKAAGTTTQPAGIFYSASALDTISDFGDICDMEAAVEDANVLGEIKYIMSNKAKAALRGMIKGTNGTGMVYENGEVDGTPAFNTANVDSSCIAVGDWSNLAIGQWGGIDLTVDPYTQATNGMVRLVVNAYVDAKVLRTGAIKVATL